MLQDIRNQEILKILFTSGSIAGILGGTFLTGLIDTANLIFNLQRSLTEV